MSELIDVTAYPVKELLPILLMDKSTKKNIIWATDAYEDYGPGFDDKNHINVELLTGNNDFILRPRISKTLEEQQARTRKKAEVMTPVWLCNKMNNMVDEQWFGRKDVFNHENEDNTWTVNENPIVFEEKRTWEKYVDSKRLEITCGEAPYIVSRYDTTTGELIIPPLCRIGLLDRKLRVVNENTNTKEEWLKWAERAVQSCYGFDYCGDNVLLSRINVLLTFREYFMERWPYELDMKVLKRIANVICWNIWQMDGQKNTVPLGKHYEEFRQMSLFDLFETEKEEPEREAIPCKIYDWRANTSLEYRNIKNGG